MNKPPRSLFKSPERAARVESLDSAALIELFKAAAKPASTQLRENLDLIARAAAKAESDPTIARGTEYAHSAASYLERLEEAIAKNDAIEAAQAALKLAEVWMQLRADVFFAAAVREKEHRKARNSALSDDDIRREVARSPTLKAAAERLGISERQLRNRREHLLT
jgi:hypothetical protein